MSWKIYHKDGTPLKDKTGRAAETHSLEYSGEWMGECAVTSTFESASAMGFAIGDWLEYRGERFVLNYDPGKRKQGRSGAVGDAFRYESVKFNALSDELTQAEFIDVVLGKDNQLHYTALPVFTFYIETLDDLLDRLQACMDEQLGEGQWHFYSRNWERSSQRGCDGGRWEEMYGGKATADGDTGVSDTEIDSTSVSIDKQTVWDGLALVNSQFDVNFVVKNREVFVGTAGLPTANIFKYGKGNGLYEIDQDADSDQKVVTRMRAYGSDKNLPTRYYSTLNMEVWAESKNLWAMYQGNEVVGLDITTDLASSSISAYFHIVATGKSGDYAVDIKVGEHTASGTVTSGTGADGTGRCVVSLRKSDGTSAATMGAMANELSGGGRVYFTRGVTRTNFPEDHKAASSENLPNNMACDRLMLPGFPNQSLQEWWDSQDEATRKRLNPTGAELRFSTQKDRPWIESANADEVGVRPGSVYFDTEDTKNKIEEIYPTLEEMSVGGERVDEIAAGSSVEDNGVYREGQTVPGFTLTLKKALDIDINDLKSDGFSVVMKDGMCAGRTFQVGGSEKKDGRWVLTMQRVEDGGVWYPYKDFQIKAGDHFVLTGIEMPKAYVDAASEKLLEYAIKWLLANDYTRYTYQPKVDEIFMARQHDAAMADKTGATKSLHDTLKEGDLMLFEDDDLGIDGAVTISHLTIKEEDGKIPSYEITLREDKEVGSIQKMQEQINAIVGGNGGGGGGLTLAQARSVVESEGGKHFLSKTGDDTAAGLIGFGKGLTTGGYSAGKTGGSLDAEGNAEVESLAVRGDANVGGGLTVGKGSWINADGSARLGDTVADTLRSATFDDVLQRGFGLLRDAQSGKYTMSVTDLMVWGKAVFTELEIRRLYSVGGNVYLSGASGRIQHVAAVYGGDGVTVEGWKCWLLADDGTTATQNCFARYDQAKCQTFGIEEGVHEGVGNRYYWRLVTDASTASEEITDADGNVLYEGKRFAWVVLSATDCEDAATNDAPAAGDVIVLDGHRQFAQGDAEGRDKYNDKSRTNVMMLQTTGSDTGAVPNIVALTGITDYRHSEEGNKYSNTVFVLSPEEVVFVSARFKWIRNDGTVADAESVWGGLEASTEGLRSEFGTLEKDLQGSDPTTLKRYTSAIKQSARGISLEVSANTLKKDNLLGGTAFRRKDAALWLETEADTADLHTGGYGGANYVRLVKKDSIADMRYYGIKWGDAETRDGTQCPNIQVRKGRYTLAFMMRKSSATGIYCDTQVLKGSGPWTRASNMGSMMSGSVQTASETAWKLVTYTLDVTADCWLCVTVRMRAATDKQGVWVDVCQPCLVEGDFYSWRESTLDCGYIGGNLLDGARSLSVGGNLSLVEGTVETGADGLCSVTRTTDTAIGEVLEWKLDGKLELGTDYTFSFWAKGSGTVATYMYHGSDGISIDAEGSNGASVTGWGDGNINFALTGVWTRCWVHWRNNGTGQADRVLLRAQPGTTVTAMKPKLEVGATATEWTDNPQTYVEEGSLVQRLYATGINITDGSIDMTADKFTLRNNKGERSFGVDAEGNLEARSLRSVSADGSLVVTVADGAFKATTPSSGASAFIGLVDGMPCLQFTNLAGVVTYAIGAAGAVVDTDGGLKLTGVSGGYTVSATTVGTEGWTVMYSVDVTVRNTSQESVQVSASSLTLAITGFTKTLTPLMQLSAADTQLGLGYAVVMAGDERTFTFATAAETVARKNADGSYNAEPSGTRGCEVRYAGKRIGMGAAKKV